MSDAVAAVSVASDSHTPPEDRFIIDGMPPDRVARPANLEELRTVLSEAHDRRHAVIPIGGSVHRSLGNVPAAYDVALDTTRLDRIVEYEPDDLTVTVEAGIRLSALERLLREHRQFLPLDAPGAGDCTVGGILATGLSGPLRHAFGTPRDWVLGMRVVHADGAATKSGGRVVKNVTGYDLHKLHMGALGSLGVIAEVTCKLAPLPRAEHAIAVTAPTAAAACALALAANDRGLSLIAAEVFAPPAARALAGLDGWALLARAAGGATAVARTVRELQAAADRSDATTALDLAWPDVAPAWHEALRPRGVAFRIAVRPTDVASVVDALDRRLAGHAPRLSATVCAGLVRVVLSPREGQAPSIVEAARAIAARANGTLVFDALPADIKREMDVFGAERPDIAIMRRLKQEFDPKRILSPGRFAGRI